MVVFCLMKTKLFISKLKQNMILAQGHKKNNLL